MPFPDAPSSFPDKDQVADYLERYAERFDLPVRLGVAVRSLTSSRGHYVLLAGDMRLEATNVIVATGPFHAPRIPEISCELAPHVQQLHSSGYVNPHLLREGPAPVVGAGNSGTQIAMELSRFRRVWLAGRPTGHTPRALMGRDIYDWIWPVLSRLSIDTVAGRMVRDRFQHADPLVGISNSQIAASGVTRVGRLAAVARGVPVCTGRPVPAAVVIWAAGFSRRFDWIQLPMFDDDGSPWHQGGVVPGTPGLYFLGLRFQRTYASSLLGGVGHDAAIIAERIAGAVMSVYTGGL